MLRSTGDGRGAVVAIMSRRSCSAGLVAEDGGGLCRNGNATYGYPTLDFLAERQDAQVNVGHRFLDLCHAEDALQCVVDYASL